MWQFYGISKSGKEENPHAADRIAKPRWFAKQVFDDLSSQDFAIQASAKEKGPQQEAAAPNWFLG